MSEYVTTTATNYFAKRNDGTYRKVNGLPKGFVFVSGGGADIYWLIFNTAYKGKYVKKADCVLYQADPEPPPDPLPGDVLVIPKLLFQVRWKIEETGEWSDWFENAEMVIRLNRSNG